jgi:hypothetical protein
LEQHYPYLYNKKPTKVGVIISKVRADTHISHIIIETATTSLPIQQVVMHAA